MDKKTADSIAESTLNTILNTQHNLLSYANQSTDDTHGNRAAQFCIAFIETYSAWLQQNRK